MISSGLIFKVVLNYHEYGVIKQRPPHFNTHMALGIAKYILQELLAI